MSLGSTSAVSACELIPGSPSRAPSRLEWRSEMPREIVERHDEAGYIRPLSLYRIKGAEYGGQGLLRLGDDLFAPLECFPDYLAPMVRQSLGNRSGEIWYGALFSWRRRKMVCDRPILVPFHPNFVYGHFLLEMLPRLLLADLWEPSGAPLALSTRTPGWVRSLVGIVAPRREIIWFDGSKEVLVAPAFIVPSTLQGGHHHLHPELQRMIANLKSRAGLEPMRPATRKLYLSRSRISEVGAWHRIRDEEAVERLFADRGFEVIHPQEIGFAEQLALYDSAAVIAGEFSSALHNTLFARPGCRTLSINWINWHQSRIATLMQQPIGYLPTIDGFVDWQAQARGFQRLDVDVDNLGRRLDAFLDVL